eukprot:2394527-Amphidinium_carterae.2
MSAPGSSTTSPYWISPSAQRALHTAPCASPRTMPPKAAAAGRKAACATAGPPTAAAAPAASTFRSAASSALAMRLPCCTNSFRSTGMGLNLYTRPLNPAGSPPSRLAGRMPARSAFMLDNCSS